LGMGIDNFRIFSPMSFFSCGCFVYLGSHHGTSRAFV